MKTMAAVRAAIIPRTISGGDELVVIPRKEYERLKAQKVDDAVPPVIIDRIPFSSLTAAQRKRFRIARKTPISKMLNI